MASHWHYPDTLPLTNFTSLVEEATLELQKSHNFLIRATEQPILLFKEADIYLKSNRNIVTAIMTTSYLKDNKVNVHAFQVYLASVLDKALQSWVIENRVKHDVRVFVRQPNSFPSNFAVYVNEQEIVQFNIFEKWYGVRMRIHSEETLVKNAEKEVTRLQGEIKEIEKRMDDWNKVIEKPTSFVRTPSDIFALFFKRKKIRGHVEKRLLSLESKKEGLYTEIQRTTDNVPKLIETQQTKIEFINLVIPFFKELSYDLKEKKSELY